MDLNKYPSVSEVQTRINELLKEVKVLRSFLKVIQNHVDKQGESEGDDAG